MLRHRFRLLMFWLRVQAKRVSFMDRFRISEAVQVKWLAFIGACCAVVAQAEPYPAEIRYGAAAIAAGCAAVVALSRSPGQPRPPDGKG